MQLQIPILITCSMEQNVVSFTSRNLIVIAFSVIFSFYIPALSYFDLISFSLIFILISFLVFSQPIFLFHLLSRISILHMSSNSSSYALLDSCLIFYCFPYTDILLISAFPISSLAGEKFPFLFISFVIVTLSTRYVAFHFALG